MAVRSFSLINPMAEDGTTNERKFGVFCNWVTAVAHFADEVSTEAGRKNFDIARWRSVRPWLSFSDLHNCYLKFLQISIGSMQCGPIRLTNQQVNALVMYERRLCNKRSHRDIVEIILQLYRKTATRRTQRTVVFKDVNRRATEERAAAHARQTRRSGCARSSTSETSARTTTTTACTSNEYCPRRWTSRKYCSCTTPPRGRRPTRTPSTKYPSTSEQENSRSPETATPGKPSEKSTNTSPESTSTSKHTSHAGTAREGTPNDRKSSTSSTSR